MTGGSGPGAAYDALQTTARRGVRAATQVCLLVRRRESILATRVV